MNIPDLRTETRWGLLLLWLLLTGPSLAQTWFPPSTSWLATQLREVGCQEVRHRGAAVGGLRSSDAPGPTVVFSSNDPEAAIKVLAALGPPTQGKILVVFGPEVKIEQGDYLIKAEFDDSLAKRQVALPDSGPSVDSFELIVSRGGSMPAIVVASDLVLALQNRARTASEMVVVQLERYRPLEDGNLAVDLSLRVFDPAIREPAAKALIEIANDRLASNGATLVSSHHQPGVASGQWPMMREALGSDLTVLQNTPPRTALYLEDFGRPEMPSITVRAGSTDPAIIQGLARVLALALKLEKRPEEPAKD